jgi:sulfite reductase alpha subunit-like flavoprotein
LVEKDYINSFVDDGTLMSFVPVFSRPEGEKGEYVQDYVGRNFEKLFGQKEGKGKLEPIVYLCGGIGMGAEVQSLFKNKDIQVFKDLF